MSDEWKFFMCSMGENLASIMVDVGISGDIQETPPNLATVALTYKQPDERGLPTNDEFDAVVALEDRLDAFVKRDDDAYVGRITKEGQRIFFIYTHRAEAPWAHFVEQLAKGTGYKLDLLIERDPDHSQYWKYLYPTPDDWCVIKDMAVCDVLNGKGDDPDAERKIDHWVYFPDAKAAQPFVEWAVKDGFVHDAEYSGPDRDGEYCARLHHVGPTRQQDVSRRTIALQRKATELGGRYDGWETFVLSRSAQEKG